MKSYRQAEVEWYLANGRHRSRIALDSAGHRYVIGDWSWSRMGKPYEVIEPEMEYRLKSSQFMNSERQPAGKSDE